MNKRDFERTEKLYKTLKMIPRFISGGGSQSTTIESLSGYARDMSYVQTWLIKYNFNLMIEKNMPTYISSGLDVFDEFDYQEPDLMLFDFIEWVMKRESDGWA